MAGHCLLPAVLGNQDGIGASKDQLTGNVMRGRRAVTLSFGGLRLPAPLVPEA